jgi:hypothetical protein
MPPEAEATTDLTATSAQAPADDSEIADFELLNRQDAPDDDVVTPDEDGEDETSGQAASPEMFEFEDDEGTKHKVPVALKDAFLRRDAFTQKTQTLAEQQRDLEARQTQWQKEQAAQASSLQELNETHANVAVLNHQLQRAQSVLEQVVDPAQGLKLKDVNWQAYRSALGDAPADDPDRLRYERLREAYLGARENITDLGVKLNDAKTELTTKQEAHQKTIAEQGQTALVEAQKATGNKLKEIVPGWNVEKANEVITFMTDTLGITQEEVATTTDPRLWVLIHEHINQAKELEALRKNRTQQQVAEDNKRAQAAQPAARANSNGGRAPDPTKASADKMDTKAWMASRNKQLEKRARA